MAEDNRVESSDGIRLRILEEMEQVGSCTLNQLVRALPGSSWNQVFFMVDCLNREGVLSMLRHPTTLEYVVEFRSQRKGGMPRP